MCKEDMDKNAHRSTVCNTKNNSKNSNVQWQKNEQTNYGIFSYLLLASSKNDCTTATYDINESL